VLPNDSVHIARSPRQIAVAVPFSRSNLRRDTETPPPQPGVYVPRRLASQPSRGATTPDAPFGSSADSELTWAGRLLRPPNETMLVLLDGGSTAAVIPDVLGWAPGRAVKAYSPGITLGTSRHRMAETAPPCPPPPRHRPGPHPAVAPDPGARYRPVDRHSRIVTAYSHIVTRSGQEGYSFDPGIH
jgi:hypothetical protein